MTGSPPSFELLLGKWEHEWRRQRAPIAEGLRPGITPNEIFHALSAVKLTPTPELVALWTWHDGVRQLPGQGSRTGGNAMELLSLDEALREREFRLDLSTRLSDDDRRAGDEGMWPKGWLPFAKFGNGDVLTQDCAKGDTPVWWVSWEDPDFKTPVLPSLYSLVRLCVDLLRSGAWLWDRASQQWEIDRDRASAEARTVGLV